MGTVYRAHRNRWFGNLLKAVLIVLAVMLFWGTFLWVGLDMHLPSAAPAAVSAEAEESLLLDAGEDWTE